MPITKQNKLVLLHELRRIIHTRPDRRPAWFRPDYGLCSNFELMCRDRPEFELMCRDRPECKDVEVWYALFRNLFSQHIFTWPHYSGNTSYYIPAIRTRRQQHSHPEAEYASWKNLYDRRSPYCRLRYDLLDYVIECVDNE